jgi:hypothetical protein
MPCDTCGLKGWSPKMDLPHFEAVVHFRHQL